MVKRLPWVSLTLLIVCYASFGWYLAGLSSPKPLWLVAGCYQLIGEPVPNNLEIPGQSTVGQARSRFLGSVNLKEFKPKEGQLTSPTSKPTDDSTQPPQNICSLARDHNLISAVLAISWIVLSSLAFMSPLTNLTIFLTRWFNSDTVAFTAIFLFAAFAAVGLYWLHIFTQILTILAAETLARIDLQTRSVNGMKSFWLLTTVCLFGLIVGWAASTIA